MEPDVVPDLAPPTEAPTTPAPSRSPEIAGYVRTERHYIRDNNNVGYEGLTHQQCAGKNRIRDCKRFMDNRNV